MTLEQLLHEVKTASDEDFRGLRSAILWRLHKYGELLAEEADLRKHMVAHAQLERRYRELCEKKRED